MTSDPVARAARAAAARLQAEQGMRVAAEMEAALAAREAGKRPDRYVDPVGLASLIVSIASLAWQVYDSRRKEGGKPTAPSLAREVRLAQRERTGLDGTQERIIEIVVGEIIKAEDDDQ